MKRTPYRLTIALVGMAALSAGAIVWLGAPAGATPRSAPDYVSPRCVLRANTTACAVALRYLGALDLDQVDKACAMLDRGTLDAAGGIAGCTATLSTARGIRIRYSLLAVLMSPLGRTIRFWTAARGRAPINQQMLVSPAGRIVAIVPEPATRLRGNRGHAPGGARPEEEWTT